MEVVKLVFWALIALFVLVTFHEYGHYWVARRCGVRVLRFSIGFGKPLMKWHRGDTEFVLAAIPLGGYVKMYGETHSETNIEPGYDEEEITESDKHLSFSHKTVWQRMAIVVAGPVANLLLAIIFYFFVFLGGTQGIAPIIGSVKTESAAFEAGVQANTEVLLVDGHEVTSWGDVFEKLMNRIGETGEIQLVLSDLDTSEKSQFSLKVKNWLGDTDKPDFLGSLGIEPYRPEFQAVIGQIVVDSPAEKSGLEVSDLIIETAEKPIENWEQWREIVRASPGISLNMLVERDGEILSLRLTPESKDEEGISVGLAGVAPMQPEWPEDLMRDKEYGFTGAFMAAVSKTTSSSLFILDSLKKLVTGQVSTKSLGGPVSIAKIAGASADAGWQAFLSFLAIMSVMLGVMNLMPIPVLDGGHLVFYIIEAIKGSPLSEVVQGAAMRLGMFIVFGIMSLALYNDFMRL